MTHHTDAELLRDIEEHMRKMWDARLLPAVCWPADLAQRLTQAVRRAPAAPAPQVSIEKLEDWKRRVNTLATCGLKADRYRVGSALKQDIADAIAAQPAAQGMDAQTAYEAECFRWLRDKALDVWKKGPVVFMTDADGCPGSGGELTNNILTGKKLEQEIPVAAQAKQGEQP